jgi:predicted phage baseplate assembly protein
VWVRARAAAPLEVAPEVSGLHLNTTRATAATTASPEVLGTSAGRPNETFKLKRAPVLIDPTTGQPELTVELLDATGTRREVWQRSVDFYGAGRDSQVYLLDPGTGVLTFGDGVNGRIPVAGSRIIASHYRVGGGAAGNVSAGTITALKTALPQVRSVSNLRGSAGGSDAETLEEAKLRAPQLLRTRDRAVAASDFADLAMRTPGVDLRSARALPLTALDLSTTPPTTVEDVPGAVTVVVLPNNEQATPQPSEEQMRLICAYLNERRLITTELYVTGPRYVDITELRAEILATSDAELKKVQDTCRGALERYFHPLTGGERPVDGSEPAGWPVGGAIYVGNVFDLLLGLPGVARVAELAIGIEGQPADDCSDVLPVGPGSLVHLPEAVLSLDVRYGRGH